MKYTQFSEFVLENKKINHDNGTYVSVNVDKESSEKLDTWATNNNITNRINPGDFHATVIYSRAGVPAVEDYDLKLPPLTPLLNTSP